MKALRTYNIPFKGLKNGIHQFDYQINSDFFELFENSVLKQGTVDVLLTLEKKTGMILLNFGYEGIIPVECDRCLTDFGMPLKGEEQLIVKFSEEEKDDEDNIVYIHPKAIDINVAHYIYEIIHLGIPLRKACEEQDDGLPSCGNEAVINLLLEPTTFEEDNDNEEENISSNPAWNILKDIKIN